LCEHSGEVLLGIGAIIIASVVIWGMFQLATWLGVLTIGLLTAGVGGVIIEE
jgi:hypothetical protein